MNEEKESKLVTKYLVTALIFASGCLCEFHTGHGLGFALIIIMILW